MVQSIQDFLNTSNRINARRSQTSIPYIKFPGFFSLESGTWKRL